MASPLRAAPAEIAGWLRFNVPHPGCGLQACTLGQRAGDIRHLDLWLINARRRCQHAPGNLARPPAAVRRVGAATGWPDLMVATVMTDLALPGATPVIAPARPRFWGRQA
jgi:hypothetical protein